VSEHDLDACLLRVRRAVLLRLTKRLGFPVSAEWIDRRLPRQSNREIVTQAETSAFQYLEKIRVIWRDFRRWFGA
jgi:hypothetical protein